MYSAGDLPVMEAYKIRREEKTMISSIAVFTFLLIVGVCSYVVLNPGSCFAERKIMLVEEIS
jgi:hypothetical protein